jgi:hypothetical protein
MFGRDRTKPNGIIAGQKGLRRSSRNMFVFSSRIFEQGWFARYTLLTTGDCNRILGSTRSRPR